MPLVGTERITDADRRAWDRLERFDARLAWSAVMDRRIETAQQHIIDFVAAGPCYAGVSWGKDSMALAGLIMSTGVRVPLVWVRMSPRDNPDCVLVRDAFLARFPTAEYHEITVECRRRPDGGWVVDVPTGVIVRRPDLTSGPGFAIASERFGDRYLTGIRSAESAARKMREATHGIATERTCAPISRWSGVNVFAYLYRAGLPVHPAYACSYGGALDRERIRVAHLDGSRGTGHGRREWEWAYYRSELIALGEDLRVML